jgi:hypothetical protein
MAMHQNHDVTEQFHRLHPLLLTYLREACVPQWPGADGATIEDVLRSYPQAVRAGLVPDLPSLLASHPELSDALRLFFRRYATPPIRSSNN